MRHVFTCGDCGERNVYDETLSVEHAALVERALQDALKLGAACPQSIRDLLFHVHGKVIA